MAAFENEAKKTRKLNRQRLKERIWAIIDGYHPDSEMLLIARHAGQCPEIDGQIIINDAPSSIKKGQLVEVEITGSAGYDLIDWSQDGGHRLPMQSRAETREHWYKPSDKEDPNG